jgi:hypothetical protein
MSWDGSGNFLRIMNWQDDAQAGIKIKSDRHDQQDDDFANGLSNAITKDGQSQPVANIPMNGKRIVNLGDPVADGDVANKRYVDLAKTFTTSLVIAGADLNGRVNFTSTTGVQGLSFTAADLSWLAKLAGAPAGSANRLVLNDKPDGTGTDVVTITDAGNATFNGAVSGISSLYVRGATGNEHLWFLGPADVQRAIIYTNAAAQGHLVFSLGNGQTFYMTTAGDIQSPGNVYTGGGISYVATNGNVIGSIWDNFGAHDAYTAINARIENRAQAWAINYCNACAQSTRVASEIAFRRSGVTGKWENSGWLFTGVKGDSAGGDAYYYARHFEVYYPNQGWVQGATFS